jgi:hypothetical protein
MCQIGFPRLSGWQAALAALLVVASMIAFVSINAADDDDSLLQGGWLSSASAGAATSETVRRWAFVRYHPSALETRWYSDIEKH